MTRFWRYALIAVGIVFLANLGIGAYLLTHGPDDPLGAFPVQRVVEVTAEGVTIEGTKCADRPVRISGESFWRSVDTPGLAVPLALGVRQHPGGCETRVYYNLFPAAVIAHPGVWQIVGTSCPIDDDGKRVGLCRSFETANFQVEG